MITRIKQCGLFALSFVLALTACFTVFSNNTYAATNYDYVKSLLIDNLDFSNGDENKKNLDQTLDWFTDYKRVNGGFTEGDPAYLYEGNVMSADNLRIYNQMYNYIRSGENSGWIVIKNDSDSYKIVAVKNKNDLKIGIENPSYPGQYLTWRYTGSLDDVAQCSITKYYAGSYFALNDCFNSPYLSSSKSGGQFDDVVNGVNMAGDQLGYNTKVFLVNLPVIYPEGYDGVDIPDSYVQKNKFVPNIVYTVDKKKFLGTFCQYEKCGAPPGFGDISSLNINYKITSNLTGEVVLEKSGSLKDINVAQINYEFKDYGKYTLTATYSPPIPYVQPEDQEWIKLNLPLNINGASYASNAISQECLEDGNCVEYDGQKDCSLEDGIFNQIKCEVNNYGVRLSMWFFNLFNDFAGYIIEFFYDFSVRLKSMFSVLFLPVDFVKALFNPMTEYSGNISCAGASPPSRCVWRAQWASGGYLNFNGSMGIDWGIVEKSYPTLWSYLQWFARLIFGYGCYVYLNHYRERFIR